MRCVDVNVLVYAHRPESPDHAEWRTWLDNARRGAEPLGLMSAVLTGFLRVVTHPRVFKEPTPLDVAVDFVEVLRDSPAARRIEPGDRHWALFTELCRQARAVGNHVPDASIAATAIEHGATLVSADRGFARYAGLRLDHPI